MPGPGGSMDQCAVCGESFIIEVLLGNSIESFSVNGIDAVLYSHKPKCKDILVGCGKDWKKLPAGPLRKAFEEATTERVINLVTTNGDDSK